MLGSAASDQPSGHDRTLSPVVRRLRSDRYDPIARRTESLAWTVTRGAQRIAPLLTLSDLRAILEANPDSTAVVSDIHGYDQLLFPVLCELGAVSPRRERQGNFRLVSLGDAADGRSDTDAETLALIEKYFDVVVAGNHEAALLGGPRFEGMLPFDRPEVIEPLRRLAWRGKLTAAMTVGDILLTHAGVSSDLLIADRAVEDIATFLNRAWQAFLGNPREQSPFLFQVSAHRMSDPAQRATAPRWGGSLWEHWNNLVLNHPSEFRQIVGHTSLGAPEVSLDGRVHAIDVAGYRLGVAVITPRGEIHVGSDFIL